MGVGIPGSPYAVHVGERVLPQLPGLALAVLARRPGRAFLCADAGVPEGFVCEVRAALESAGLGVTFQALPGGEGAKTIAGVERLLVAMAAARLERWDPVVALGGGAVGDAAAFAASIYRRGVPVVQCPSTLLAMVDASVGGKTGVNLDLAAAGVRKNLVGTFHQPASVLADTRLLATLPDRVFRCGLAECVKHGLIAAHAGDPGLLEWTERHAAALAARDPGVLGELIARNVAVKARVVEGDPREEAPAEQGGRALLNLGHTFAHALEPIPDLSPTGRPGDAPIQHGEAVALGLVAASRCAAAMACCAPDLPDRVVGLLKALGLPVQVAGLPSAEAVIDRMLDDKKTSGGRLRLVVPTEPGRARIIESPPRNAVAYSIGSLRRANTPD